MNFVDIQVFLCSLPTIKVSKIADSVIFIMHYNDISNNKTWRT